ncbi:MAG: hypothetical protein Q4F72_07695 [Desulfovibrionaceae bacterium]|nr:hypothetical protein [Desulfovibrionaceae bacterium]
MHALVMRQGRWRQGPFRRSALVRALSVPRSVLPALLPAVLMIALLAGLLAAGPALAPASDKYVEWFGARPAHEENGTCRVTRAIAADGAPVLTLELGAGARGPEAVRVRIRVAGERVEASLALPGAAGKSLPEPSCVMTYSCDTGSEATLPVLAEEAGAGTVLRFAGDNVSGAMTEFVLALRRSWICTLRVRSGDRELAETFNLTGARPYLNEAWSQVMRLRHPLGQ